MSRARLVLPAACGLALLATLACGNPLSQPTGVDVEQPGTDVAGVAVTPDGPGVSVRAVGPDLVGPTRVIVHTRSDLFPAEAVGNPPPDGTQLVLEPPVEGTFTVTARDTLQFVPTGGFVPGTKYSVALKSLSTGPETYSAEDGGIWTTAFETPSFGYARSGLVRHDVDDATVEILVMFTAAVDPKEVQKHASFTFRGSPVKPATVVAGGDPWEVRVTFRDRVFRDDGELGIAFSDGIPYARDSKVVAPSASGKLDIKPGAPIEILATHVQEGGSGFYVDVVCNDHSITTTRYYWDNTTYEDYQVSTRCLLSDDEVASAVHFEPSVEGVSVASAPGGFRLFAPFQRGTYHMTLDAGAASVDGGVIQEAYEADLEIPARSAKLEFTGQGRYLPREAWKNLTFTHRNISAVDVEIRHIPEQNLVFWLTGSENAGEETSDVIAKTTIQVRGAPDTDATSSLDVRSLVDSPDRGVYQITMRAKVPIEDTTGAEEETRDTGYHYRDPQVSEDGKWRYVATSKARLLLTDIQLIAKVAKPTADQPYTPSVAVWTVNSETGATVGGVDVKLVRPSGFGLAECRTGLSGQCTMEVPLTGPDETAPFALIASKGDDLTYIEFADLRIDATSDTSGVPYVLDRPYDAAVYTDRGVYRPGETAHVAALLRDDNETAPEAGLPVVLKLYDPQGKLFKKKILSTNPAGMAEAAIELADFARTGRYRAELEVADERIGQASFSVEEFVPERLSVDATAAKEVLSSDPVPVDVAAKWLFGGSAEGNRVDVACQVRPSSFAPVGLGDYHFGPSGIEDSRVRPVDLGTVTGAIGADGHVSVVCPAAAKGGGFQGPSELVAQVSVFEGDGGRSTSDTVSVDVHPDTFYVGLKVASGKVNTDGTTHVEGVLADWAGKPVSGTKDVQLEVQRLDDEIGWVWDDDAGGSVYRQMYRRSKEVSKTVQVGADGKFTLDFDAASDDSRYVVIAKTGNTRTELVLDAAWYYWDWYSDSGDSTPRPERPTDLPMVAPATVDVGQDATVKLVAPYKGRMLLAVETDHVVDWDWVDVDKAGPVEWTFKVKDFAPNVYVTAFLVKDPHAESAQAFLPDRAFGAASVRVKPAEYTQDVKIAAPAEIRPNSKLELDLNVGNADDTTFVTVAAVDSGILSLTDFEDPDPFNQIFRKRALGVDSYETIGWTLAIPPASAAGGDSVGNGGRVQMVKPVALWSGIVPVSADGKAHVSFDVPAYRGNLHVMAVSSGKSRMGHASADVLVRDPLTLQTTLPRFLTGDDSASVPVQITNLSGKARDIELSITVADLGVADKGMVPNAAIGPAVVLPTGDHATLHLEQGESGSATFQLTAARAPGAVKVRVTAKSGELESYEELELPIQPSQPEARISVRIPVNGTTDLTSTLADWLPGSDVTSIWVTTNPYAQSMGQLSSLVHYPYGCIEQTVSSARPLLFAGPMLAAVDPKLAKQPIDGMVMKGIERSLSMQTPSGGFGYWPGATSPNAWGSAYAVHFLLDAKDKGFAVPDTALTDGLSWLGREADRRNTASGEDERTSAYIQYVLARGGKGRAAQAGRFVDSTDSEVAYLAKAAVYKSGDRKFEADLQNPPTTRIEYKRANDKSYWSDLRERGLVLSVYEDLFGPQTKGKGQVLADVVGDSLDDHPGYWYTTQELSWGVSALGRWVGDSPGVKKASVTFDGQQATSVGDPKVPAFANSYRIERASLAGSLSVSATPADSGSQVYAIVTTEGVRKVDDLPYGGNGLSVTRKVSEPSGRPASLGNVKLGAQLVITVTVENKTGGQVDNVAVVDRLPAGFELENAQLGQGMLPDWVDTSTLWSPDYMNLRDDRVEVFGNLYNGQSATFVYTVRAVTAGSFTEPEVRAEAMYEPNTWARTRGESVVIVP